MLNSISTRVGSDLHYEQPHALQIIDLLAILRRRKVLIVASMIATFLLGALYIVVTPKMYTAQATLLIDKSRLQNFRQEAGTTDVAVDPATVESQIETLKSESITGAVVETLKLTRDPEFVGPPANPVAAAIVTLRSLLGSGEPETPESLMRKAVNVMADRMEAKRVGISLAIAVSFTSLDPKKAAAISNEIANAYLKEQVSAKVETIKQASQWLGESIAQLERRVNEADRAVLDFRSRYGIVDINGKLTGEQQLAEATTSLNAAKATAQEAKARAERSDELLAKDTMEGAVNDLLRSEGVIKLRVTLADQNARLASLVARVGANHELAVRARAEVAQTEATIKEEFRRIVESHKSDYEIARARLAAQEAHVAALTGSLAASREALPRLRELESSAQSVRNLYDAFKQRQLIATQNLSFDLGESRIITRASPPSMASAPRTGLVLAAALAFGLALGCMAALARELLDRHIRTITQIEAATQVPCLGILPRIKANASRVRADGADPAGRVFTLFKAAGPSNTVIHQPFSLFAETIRNMKVSIDTRRLAYSIQSVGIVSAQAGEGKTTAAMNLAMVMAQAGSRVLVIDADLRNPQLTRTFVPAAKAGLPEVLAGSIALKDALWREAATGIHVLPTVARGKIRNSSEIVASEAMRRLLDDASGSYDYVVLDCAPLVPVVDVRASAHLIDGFIMVTAWGETPVDVVERVASASYLEDKLLGTVLTKVDINRYKLFETYHDSYYIEADAPAK